MASPTWNERRQQPRVAFKSPATVTVGQHTVAASTRDISAGGVFFYTDVALAEGDEVEVVVVVPGELRPLPEGVVHCRGHVVRIEAAGGLQYGMAVKIEQLAPGSS